MAELEFGKDGAMKWERVSPPFKWRAAGRLIVGDRHLPDGRRQYMVLGSVAMGLQVDNADVVGEDDLPDAEFSQKPSLLSKPFPLHKLSQVQQNVLSWIGKGWTVEPGCGSSLMVNGKRICNVPTMLALHQWGLAKKDLNGCWSATECGKHVARQLSADHARLPE